MSLSASEIWILPGEGPSWQERRCPQTSLKELLHDLAFADYFNVFLSLPVFGQRVMYKLHRGTFLFNPTYGEYPRSRRVLQWLCEERYPLFAQSRLAHEYRLCCYLRKCDFTNKICADGNDDVTPKMVQTFTNNLLGSVAGMHLFRRYLQGRGGGRVYACWMHVQLFRSTSDPKRRRHVFKEIKVQYLDAMAAKSLLRGHLRDIIAPELLNFPLVPDRKSKEPTAERDTDRSVSSCEVDPTSQEALSRVQEALLNALRTYWAPCYLLHVLTTQPFGTVLKLFKTSASEQPDGVALRKLIKRCSILTAPPPVHSQPSPRGQDSVSAVPSLPQIVNVSSSFSDAPSLEKLPLIASSSSSDFFVQPRPSGDLYQTTSSDTDVSILASVKTAQRSGKTAFFAEQTELAGESGATTGAEGATTGAEGATTGATEDSDSSESSSSSSGSSSSLASTATAAQTSPGSSQSSNENANCNDNARVGSGGSKRASSRTSSAVDNSSCQKSEKSPSADSSQSSNENASCNDNARVGSDGSEKACSRTSSADDNSSCQKSETFPSAASDGERDTQNGASSMMEMDNDIPNANNNARNPEDMDSNNEESPPHSGSCEQSVSKEGGSGTKDETEHKQQKIRKRVSRRASRRRRTQTRYPLGFNVNAFFVERKKSRRDGTHPGGAQEENISEATGDETEEAEGEGRKRGAKELSFAVDEMAGPDVHREGEWIFAEEDVLIMSRTVSNATRVGLCEMMIEPEQTDCITGSRLLRHFVFGQRDMEKEPPVTDRRSLCLLTCDGLIGGPFRSYLEQRRQKLHVEYLDFWSAMRRYLQLQDTCLLGKFIRKDFRVGSDRKAERDRRALEIADTFLLARDYEGVNLAKAIKLRLLDDINNNSWQSPLINATQDVVAKGIDHVGPLVLMRTTTSATGLLVCPEDLPLLVPSCLDALLARRSKAKDSYTMRRTLSDPWGEETEYESEDYEQIQAAGDVGKKLQSKGVLSEKHRLRAFQYLILLCEEDMCQADLCDLDELTEVNWSHYGSLHIPYYKEPVHKLSMKRQFPYKRMSARSLQQPSIITDAYLVSFRRTEEPWYTQVKDRFALKEKFAEGKLEPKGFTFAELKRLKERRNAIDIPIPRRP
ncbi:hypothetical protein BaRGS_00014978, partial [Batillaria attramentaria]